MEPLNEFLRDKLEQELLNRKPIGNPTDELLEAAAENTLNALPGCTWKVLLSWDTVGPYQGRSGRLLQGTVDVDGLAAERRNLAALMPG